MTNEEMALSIQAGNTSLLLPLYKQNMGYIHQQATRWMSAFRHQPDFDLEDLKQSAYFAIYEAAMKFDPERGKYISLLNWTLRTAFEEACGVYLERQRQDPIKSSLRLEEPIFDDEGYATLSDTIADPQDDMEAVEDAIYAAYVSDTVRKAVDSLGERQRLCIAMRYFQDKSQKEIGEQLHVSSQRVHQIEWDGLRRLRKCKYTPELSEIYYGSRDYYKGTGRTAYMRTGTSTPERELLRKEEFERRYQGAAKKLSRDKKISLLVKYLDYSPSLAEWMVDTHPDRDYSAFLEMDCIESA